MSYRKRNIGNWNQGKAYKGTRKAKERQYGVKEVNQQLAEDQDPNFRYRHYSHTKNEVESLKAQLQRYEHLYETCKKAGRDMWRNYWLDCAKKARKKLTKVEQESQQRSGN